MFICKPCLKVNGLNVDGYIFVSRGLCEICGCWHACPDVHHTLLPNKPLKSHLDRG